MARPVKQRRVCERPAVEGFIPRGREACGEVRLSVDEYEVLRLMDYLGYTQDGHRPDDGAGRLPAGPQEAGGYAGEWPGADHRRRQLCALRPGSGLLPQGLPAVRKETGDENCGYV